MIDSIVLEKPSSSTPYGGGGGGGRAIDRHNPIIRDEKRLDQSRILPAGSPITTTSDHHHLPKLELEAEDDDQKRKSVPVSDDDNESIKEVDFNLFNSPASSSRCLLSDRIKLHFSSEFHHVPSSPPPREPSNPPTLLPHYNRLRFFDGDHDSPSSSPPKLAPKLPLTEPVVCYDSVNSNKNHHDSLSSSTPKPPSPPPPPPPPSSEQVVVLEVSLHCRGCERKMKKHISKIEGVTSFKIEFEAKKVTVVGDVTPLAVLTSVLKVKNAKLLTPATISSSQAISNGF